MATTRTTGVILAGGKNRRMGTNKALLTVNGATLINRTVTLFRSLFEEIVIVTNSPLLYLDLNVTLVTDMYRDKGAIGGLYTGLFFASFPRAFVCACDMPFLNGPFIDYMLHQTGEYDAVVPDSGDGLQPLHAIYSKTCLSHIKKVLDRNNLKIADLYKSRNTLFIREESIRLFDSTKKMFQNVNTYDDFQRIMSSWKD